ncbi:hypothetical protein Rsub_04880 [Raphidocelis subcapitata]|uniref:HMG-CoA synthase n=1 Tax=Raphidocelis subcapitata TaxID=307507 RepID=A0A2V0NU95_9CHLO|nr:hypothetical protein Rsub_04880 [Raphidocelis subcapitata]|eukprot:GBF91211.1 hypothetical protein Rsub_04880 [Raphidocelis subcapitata]
MAAPRDVGILGLYLYFPRYLVEQSDLEAADGVPGKYTSGLGQRQLGFCGDREDVVSMGATAMLRLMEAYGVDAAEVGKLEVGTETAVDRSKSVMSYLMEHLNARGNTSAQGADNVHGCYGGTAALFHAADWVCGPSWDGRLAVVVATDVAVYEAGSSARATGGAGAVAMLVGPDAPLALEPPPWRGHFSAHAFDFFKPLSSPAFPVVDGPATLLWYARASDACGAAMHEAAARAGCGGGCGGKHCGGNGIGNGLQPQLQQQVEQRQRCCAALLPQFAYYLAHAPFNKLVRKTFARLALQDALRCARSCGRGCSAEGAAAPAAGGAEAAAGAPWAAACNGCGTPALHVRGSRGVACVAAGAVAVMAAPAGPAQAEAGSGGGSGSSGSGAAACSGVMALPPCAAGLDPQALPDSSITDKALERAAVEASAELYDRMAAAGAAVQRRLGNLYTASLYSGLAGLLESHAGGAGGASEDGGGGGGGAAALLGRRLLLFSYGSGVQASLFALRARAGSGRFTLEALTQRQDVRRRLDGRLRRPAAAFAAAMAAFHAGHAAAPFQPEGEVGDLEPGAVYLERVDAAHRRHYARAPR